MDAIDYLNPQDSKPYPSLSEISPVGGGPIKGDVSQRLAVSGIWQLPFGTQRKFLGHGIPGYIVGVGFQFLGNHANRAPIPYRRVRNLPRYIELGFRYKFESYLEEL